MSGIVTVLIATVTNSVPPRLRGISRSIAVFSSGRHQAITEIFLDLGPDGKVLGAGMLRVALML